MLPAPFRAACLLVLAGGALVAADAGVRLEQQDGGWRLLRSGLPFRVQGAGGSANLRLLAGIGGNTARTWGADDIRETLDTAHANGLAVSVGIWLGHERHGFNYNDPAQVQRQFEMAKSQVLKWKDHPAVLVWGLGNEMEGFQDGGNPAIWKAVQDIARMVKEIDPRHPTMTTVAEIGGKRVASIHQLCPDIDIVGINTYAGGPSIPERYRTAGGTKPYIITEYGPPGTWEIGKSPLGTVDEPTSTAKAGSYMKSWAAFAADRQLCLGAIAFTWGNKVEATASWYGMILPEGDRLEAVDAFASTWGRPVQNRCPQIQAMTFAIGWHPTVKPGQLITATVAVEDPEQDPLTATWVIAQELSNYDTGGDHIDMPPTFPEALVRQQVGSCEFRAPESGGTYRIYTYVHDGKGGAAMANATFRVDGPALPPKPPKAALPAAVAGGEGKPLWAPAGYMGDVANISMTEASTDRPKVGASCLKVAYTADKGWGGVVWQSPANDWGAKPGGWNLDGAKALKFWARGAIGGEKVKFGFGLIGNDKPFNDSAKMEREVTLGADWQEFSFDLAGRDFHRIKTGFMWTAKADGKPFAFYLDDVRWE